MTPKPRIAVAAQPAFGLCRQVVPERRPAWVVPRACGVAIRAMCVLLALSVAVAGGCASRSGGELIERERQWTDAMRTHDYETLDDILAAEFRLTFLEELTGLPDVPQITREMWLENLRMMTFGPIEMIQPRVTMHGEHVAAVRMRMILHDWEVNGNPIPPRYDLTDIWVRRDGRWQVINRISEPLDGSIPSGPPPGAE